MLLCGEEWFYIQCVLMLCDFWPYVQVSKLLRSCRKEGTETLGTLANLVALRNAQDISRLGCSPLHEASRFANSSTRNSSRLHTQARAC